MRTYGTCLIGAIALLTVSSQTHASCYADPERLATAMAVVVASYKCPAYDTALFGKPLDMFIRASGTLDQSTGACERERTLGMNAATERMLSGREAFCRSVEVALASDTLLAQALVEAGARKAP